MYCKNILLFSTLSILSGFVYASPVLQDRNAMVIYAPTITIYPDQDASRFPEKQLVKLLLSKQGTVEKVYFPIGTDSQIRMRIENEMRYAKFSPYIKQGVAVKSIVPFIVNFSVITEEEYRGN